MKESKLYLSFFRKNILLLCIPALLLMTMTAFYQNSKEGKVSTEVLLEITPSASLTQEHINETRNLLDHLVTLVRSPNLGSELGLDQSVEITSVRFSSYGSKVGVTSSNKELSSQMLNKVVAYLESRFNEVTPFNTYRLQIIGAISVTVISPNILLGALIGAVSGLFIGLTLALIKSYLRIY